MNDHEQAEGIADFDFLCGQWQVHHRRLNHRLVDSDEWEEFSSRVRCLQLMDGLANVDESQRLDGPWVGMSIRLYQRANRQWQISWVSPHDGVLQAPVQGSFVDGVGTFYGDDVVQGQAIRCRYIWSGKDGPAPRWEQAFSADGGLTWETNWIMTHTRP
jgi:hypothetical protein